MKKIVMGRLVDAPDAKLKARASLVMGPGVVDETITSGLKKTKLFARSNGSFHESVLSAAFYAKKWKSTFFGFKGNSYGVQVWRVSEKPGDYLNRINNTGPRVFSVTPDLVFSWHELER